MHRWLFTHPKEDVVLAWNRAVIFPGMCVIWYLIFFFARRLTANAPRRRASVAPKAMPRPQVIIQHPPNTQVVKKKTNKRVARHNYYDPVFRGLHPVPVSGVTSTFVAPTRRNRFGFDTKQALLMIYTFGPSTTRVLVWKADNTYTQIGSEIDPRPIDIRALCASIRIVCTSSELTNSGMVMVHASSEPIPIDINQQFVLQHWQSVADMVQDSNLTRSYSSDFFLRQRKFVSGPGPQTEYKQYINYAHSDANNNLGMFVGACRKPHVETLVVYFTPTPESNPSTYNIVFDEQMAQRHIPGSTLHALQKSQSEYVKLQKAGQELQGRYDKLRDQFEKQSAQMLRTMPLVPP